ncbi:hypothetical protein Hanom_Chr01g00015901 [Helianthus anomalus]
MSFQIGKTIIRQKKPIFPPLPLLSGSLEHSVRVWVDENVGKWVPDCVVDTEDMECIERDGFSALDSSSERLVEEEGVDLEMGEIGGVDIDVNSKVNGFEDTPNLSGNQVESYENIIGLNGAVNGRKKFRKKIFFFNRASSSGIQERPKKRPRENDNSSDPFELDRLIGIIKEGPKYGDGNVEDSSGSHEYCTADLKGKSLK